MQINRKPGATRGRAGKLVSVAAAMLLVGLHPARVDAGLLSSEPIAVPLLAVPSLPALALLPTTDLPVLTSLSTLTEAPLFTALPGTLLGAPLLTTLPTLTELPALSLIGDAGLLAGALGPLALQAGGERIVPIDGTETFEGTISHGGLTRSYVGVRPIGAPPGAPVLLLLHANSLQPSRMANLTRAGRLAALYGAWIYLPEAVGPNWNDDPTRVGADDVGFLDALMQRELGAHQLDASRVYVAGYSNGGFMAERVACERPALFAGLAMVASTLRKGVENTCQGYRRMPMLMFNGSSDPIVAYNGIPGVSSAPATAAFWAARNNCSLDYDDTALPDGPRLDATTVSLRRYRNCPDSDVRLYTVNGGGHTWPSTDYAGYTIALGATTFDVDATLLLWETLLPYSRP